MKDCWVYKIGWNLFLCLTHRKDSIITIFVAGTVWNLSKLQELVSWNTRQSPRFVVLASVFVNCWPLSIYSASLTFIFLIYPVEINSYKPWAKCVFCLHRNFVGFLCIISFCIIYNEINTAVTLVPILRIKKQQQQQVKDGVLVWSLHVCSAFWG